MPSQSKPSWSTNLASSAATIARFRLPDMRSYGTHVYLSCAFGFFACSSSIRHAMNDVSPTGWSRHQKMCAANHSWNSNDHDRQCRDGPGDPAARMPGASRRRSPSALVRTARSRRRPGPSRAARRARGRNSRPPARSACPGRPPSAPRHSPRAHGRTAWARRRRSCRRRRHRKHARGGPRRRRRRRRGRRWSR